MVRCVWPFREKGAQQIEDYGPTVAIKCEASVWIVSAFSH